MNPFEDYCYQFGASLVNFAASEGPGNWFGRLIAYQIKIYFLGDFYDEDTFRKKLQSTNPANQIIVTEMTPQMNTVRFTPAAGGGLFNGTISATYDVEAVVDGNPKVGEYAFEHQVTLVYRATETRS